MIKSSRSIAAHLYAFFVKYLSLPKFYFQIAHESNNAIIFVEKEYNGLKFVGENYSYFSYECYYYAKKEFHEKQYNDVLKMIELINSDEFLIHWNQELTSMYVNDVFYKNTKLITPNFNHGDDVSQNYQFTFDIVINNRNK